MSAKIQSLILILSLLTTGTMNAIASSKLTEDKYSLVKSQTTNMAITGLVSGVILLLLSGYFVFQKGYDESSWIGYLLITLSSIILLIVGGYSTNSAIKLQCDASLNNDINTSWYVSMMSSVISIVTVFLILLINSYNQRSKISALLKGKVCPPCNPPKPIGPQPKLKL